MKKIKKQALAVENTESILAELDAVFALFDKQDLDIEKIFEMLGNSVSKKVSQKLQ